MGAQSSNNVLMTAMQVGSAANLTNTPKTTQVAYISGLVTVSGANTYPASQATCFFNLPVGMFTRQPSVGLINLDAGTHTAQYRYSQSDGTRAGFAVWSITNSADITSGEQFVASMQFIATG